MYKEWTNIKKKSILYKWLFSYISILLIPVIISIFIYSESSRTVKNEINRSNNGMIKQIQLTVDNELSNIEMLSARIAMNERINMILNFKKPLADLDKLYELYELKFDLSMFRIASFFAYDYYIYMKNSNLVLNSQGHSSSKYIYETYHGNNMDSYEQWNKFINSLHRKEYAVFDDNTDSGKELSIIFTQSIPMLNPKTPAGTIVIFLNMKRLQQILDGMLSQFNGNILILDPDDKLLASAGSMENLPNILYDDLKDFSGFISKENHSGKYAISYISSEVNNWKYVSIMPVSVYLNKALYIRRLTMTGLLICMLLGLILSIYLSRMNYIPVKELVYFLRKNTKTPLNLSNNEFMFIKEALVNTIDEKDLFSQKLQQQNAAMRSDYLARILKGRVKDIENINKTLSAFNIVFVSDRFAVILFYIKDYSEIYNDDSSSPVSELKLMQFIIKNIVEELSNESNKGYVIEADEVMACIISLNSRLNESDNIKDIYSIVTKSVNFIENNLDIQLIASISGIYNTLYGITDAYSEAMEVLEYAVATGCDRVVVYDDLYNRRSEYYYPIEVELQFINFIKAGDYEKSSNILEDIFKNNLEKSSLSVYMLKCFEYDLFSTIMKIIESLDRDIDKEIGDGSAIIEMLAGNKTLMDIKNTINNLIREICKYINSRKKSHNEYLKDNIILYIYSNYMNINHGISDIAKKFDMNPKYLSRFFKEQTGESLSDFINKYRISKAKKLMSSSNESINFIAYKNGYSSINTFFRIFKKYEGITPGQYRLYIRSKEKNE